MRPAILAASLLACASLSACASPPPEPDPAAKAATDVPAASQHWEPAPVVDSTLPQHPRNSNVFIKQ